MAWPITIPRAVCVYRVEFAEDLVFELQFFRYSDGVEVDVGDGDGRMW